VNPVEKTSITILVFWRKTLFLGFRPAFGALQVAERFGQFPCGADVEDVFGGVLIHELFPQSSNLVHALPELDRRGPRSLPIFQSRVRQHRENELTPDKIRRSIWPLSGAKTR
jgi:hypothetical protein